MEKKELVTEKAASEAQATKAADAKTGELERKKSDTKPPIGADHFLLERLFKDSHLVFQPTADVDPKSDKVVIALDTNALLLPYLLGKGDLSDLSEVYSNLAKEGRLFLPDRVAREFIKNRDRKLAEMAQAIEDRLSRMSSWEAGVTPLLLEGFPARDALTKSSETLASATKQYLAQLKELSSHVRSWRGNDPVTSLYASLFTKERMIATSLPPEKILEEFQYALRNQVPPGYKDSSKDDQGIGDVIIWMSLLELGKATKKDLIFVTGEQKADWFVRSGNRPIYPRPELIYSYGDVSGGRSLRLSSLHELLREMSAPSAFVSEVEVAEVSANNAIQAASSAHQSFNYRQGVIRRGGQEEGVALSTSSEADLRQQLYVLDEQLRHVREQISRLTGDDLNTNVALPWNRAANALRRQEGVLMQTMLEIEQRLRDLQADDPK